MNVRYKELGGIRAAGSTSPEDLAIINTHYALTPMEAADIHVRRARVAHDQYDRMMERFPLSYLRRFAETLPGKSLLAGHDTSGLPLGRWFKASVAGKTEEFPVLAGSPRVKSINDDGEEKAVDLVPGMDAETRKVRWLSGSFYVANTVGNEQLVSNIDAGVYRHVSIGFSFDDVSCDVCGESYIGSGCQHYKGQKLEDGTLVTLTYSGDANLAEARETSLVYLGAQQQAQVVKSIQSGDFDPKRMAMTPLGEDLVALKELEALARRYGAKQKMWAIDPTFVTPAVELPQEQAATDAGGESMDKKALCEALGLAADTADEAIIAAAKAAAGNAPALVTATEKADALAGKVTAAEQKAADLAPMAEVGKLALEDLKTAILADDTRLTGKAEPSVELSSLIDMCMERGDYKRLRALADEKRAAVEEKFPAGRMAKEETEPAPAPSPRAARDYMLV